MSTNDTKTGVTVHWGHWGANYPTADAYRIDNDGYLAIKAGTDEIVVRAPGRWDAVEVHGQPGPAKDTPAPQLPTEPGSVIVDVTVADLPSASWALRAPSTPEIWRVFAANGDYIELIHPRDLNRIAAWTPGKVVADGPAVTR